MPKVLITKKLPSIAQKILEKTCEVDVSSKIQMSREDLFLAVQKYDGILCTTLDFFDEELLRSATTLKVLSNYAIGLDNIDVEYAHSRNIAVYNLFDEVTNSTADLTFAIFLALIRKIPQAVSHVKNNLWKTWICGLFAGEELYGKTFGIWGFGRTGKAVAKRALGFGMNVVFYHYKSTELSTTEPIRQVSFDEFLEQSDYISLHIPLKKETKGIVNLSLFQKMKKHPVLINMARGSVVNTDDLVQALKKGLIRGAALDVTDPEPLPGTHPLCQFENCLIVPHIGTDTFECREEMARKSAQNLLQYFSKNS